MKYFGPDINRNKKGSWKYLEELRILARRNRKNLTETEKCFWESYLSGDKTGYRFLRQKPISRFILDFYCSKLLLAIEIDGESHKGRRNYDDGRDEILGTLGIKTLRFKASEVFKADYISSKLKTEIIKRKEEMSLPFIKGRQPEGQRDLKLEDKSTPDPSFDERRGKLEDKIQRDLIE